MDSGLNVWNRKLAEILADDDFLIGLISRITSRPQDEVADRLRRECRDIGVNVHEALRAANVQPHRWSDQLIEFYARTDAFLYEVVAWNRCRTKAQMREWIGAFFPGRSTGPLKILTFGDGLGFDSLYLALAGHDVTYFEVSQGFRAIRPRRICQGRRFGPDARRHEPDPAGQFRRRGLPGRPGTRAQSPGDRIAPGVHLASDGLPGGARAVLSVRPFDRNPSAHESPVLRRSREAVPALGPAPGGRNACSGTRSSCRRPQTRPCPGRRPGGFGWADCCSAVPGIGPCRMRMMARYLVRRDARQWLRERESGTQPTGSAGVTVPVPCGSLPAEYPALRRTSGARGNSRRARLHCSSRLRTCSSSRCASSLTVGNSSCSESSTLVMMRAVTARVTHLWSAGMTYHGAHSVLVAFRASS